MFKICPSTASNYLSLHLITFLVQSKTCTNPNGILTWLASARLLASSRPFRPFRLVLPSSASPALLLVQAHARIVLVSKPGGFGSSFRACHSSFVLLSVGQSRPIKASFDSLVNIINLSAPDLIYQGSNPDTKQPAY